MLLRTFLALLLLVHAAAAAAQDFPQSFRHRLGETVVPARPERVVSLGYVTHDDLLALGVRPLALRHWYGEQPHGVWPWAKAALGDAEPAVMRGEVSLERVAALAPDLIVAIGSGITADEYAVLSQIAPVLASPDDEFQTPWNARALTIGRAVGRLDEAERQVAALKARFAALREAHPQWQGASAVAAFLWSGTPGAFGPRDPRSEVLEALGFRIPGWVEKRSGGTFYADISPEDLSPLDADLVLWIGQEPDPQALRALPLRSTLKAHREGREVWADPTLAAALGFSSLLSLPYALDRLVPEIEAAADGDPATPTPSAAAAGLTQ